MVKLTHHHCQLVHCLESAVGMLVNRLEKTPSHLHPGLRESNEGTWENRLFPQVKSLCHSQESTGVRLASSSEMFALLDLMASTLGMWENSLGLMPNDHHAEVMLGNTQATSHRIVVMLESSLETLRSNTVERMENSLATLENTWGMLGILQSILETLVNN